MDAKANRMTDKCRIKNRKEEEKLKWGQKTLIEKEKINPKREEKILSNFIVIIVIFVICCSFIRILCNPCIF